MLQRASKTVPGVIDVTGFGGTVKQYLVLVDPMELNHYGITLQQVQDAIQKSNANVSAATSSPWEASRTSCAESACWERASIALDPVNVAHRAELIDNKLDDIRNVVVTQYQGNPILVSHVAKVVEGHQPRLGIVGRHLGPQKENDVVEGIVLMRKYEKSIMVSEAVKKKLDEIQEQKILPPGMKITIFNERSELVNVTKHNVLHNLLVGMGLVIAILFIFLGDLASAGIVAIMIPLALLVLDHGPLRAGQVGQPALDRRGRLRNHRRQLDDHRREHLPPHHRARRRPLAAADRPDHRRVERDRARAVLFDDDHRLRLHPAVLDVRPRRRALRPDGQHLRLRHLRRPA